MADDLISRQAAIKLLRGECVAKYPSSFLFGLFAAADELSKLTPVDAVEVVRCKDCRHSDTIDNTRYCFHWARNTDDNGFCHEGV